MRLGRVVGMLLGLAAWSVARGDEKLILLDDVPRTLSRFTVAADGSRLYFGATKYVVVDASGREVNRIGVPEGSAPRDLIPLPDGWFISCNSYASGHIGLCRPDGSEAKVLVAKGVTDGLRSDMTGWTSPLGAAVDAERKRIFVIDTTVAPRDRPDPDWSRIAVYDFDGKYVSDINRYDARAAKPDDARRTWYDDIEVDPARQIVYVLARRTHEVLAFHYDGKAAGKASASPDAAGLAVFPNGRIAVGTGSAVKLYDAKLRPVRTLDFAKLAPGASVVDLETDASGRLYASVTDPTVTFLRWPADLDRVERIGRRYLKLEVGFPTAPVVAGKSMVLHARATGSPEPGGADQWQVMIRPSDGSNLRWRPLTTVAASGKLGAATPRGLRGLYEVAVRFGDGPIDWARRGDEPTLQRTIAFVPPGASRSVAILPDSGRRAFRRGESIAVHVVRRGEGPLSPASVRLALTHEGTELASVWVAVGDDLAAMVPAALTRRLPPGRFSIAPTADGHEGYALDFDLASDQPDSPMQRIAYQESTTGATVRQADLADTAERLAYVRDYVRSMARLGFTRETDRRAASIPKQGAVAWRRDRAPVAPLVAALPPAEALGVPDPVADWEVEAYLDQAVRFGLSYDSQLLVHCAGVRFRESWLKELAPTLQRGAQWFGRYPSFYGFNYNDEMFFGGVAAEWSPEDDAWLKRVQEEQFPGKPRAEVLFHALRVMYDRFNESVRKVVPTVKLTATPMWQFPAVEGSYAPVIYRGMDETYSHYMSEGYGIPWYPAHSIEFLRRPGLPMMGVFDNTNYPDGGDVYLKNLVQVSARGIQGVGVQHTRAHSDPRGADAYRTANLLARWYGPVFAETTPLNEAAVLYSLAQDVTETRNMLGTPHWERVYALVGAGLMAGVPMAVTYEEDVASGWLIEGGKPRVGMFFLVGQTKPLPAKVLSALDAFRAAGGKVFVDADSAELPGATRLPIKTGTLAEALHDGFGADSSFPLLFPRFEAMARSLAEAVGPLRRYPADTDDPWVSKNVLDGGEVRYLMAASETSPYPWSHEALWSVGAFYNRSYLPKVVNLSFPAAPGVVYDVFDRTVVTPEVKGQRATIRADLTTFPGRLFALAPRKLGPPKVEAGVEEGTLHYRVEAVGEDGKTLAARVPLRIRLAHGETVVEDLARGTGANGVFNGALALPATAAGWTLEVTELLGGRGTSADVSTDEGLGHLLTARADVETQRGARVRDLLPAKGGMITLLMSRESLINDAQRMTLFRALQRHGVFLRIGRSLEQEVKPGVYLAVGHVPSLDVANPPNDLLGLAWRQGLYGVAVSTNVPGPGRGLITAVFAPRGDQEHAIVLLGGDDLGLAKTVRAFVSWLDHLPPRVDADQAVSTARTEPTPARPMPIAGRPAEIAPLPRLRDLVGAKLAGITVGGDGVHLLVSGAGYLRNLALVADRGDRGELVRAERVGQAPSVFSPYLSDDGRSFGASAREVSRIGQGFHLIDARTGKQDVFAGFGDMGAKTHRFATNASGDVVVAPGSHGVVCWRRDGAGAWKEAWAIDEWKRFPKLDWPVSGNDERIPGFHAFIPRGADHALILSAERMNNAWITPENTGAASLSAVRLTDGKVLWRFDVPIPHTLLFPTLQTSPDGSRVLLQVMMGSWGRETYRFFSLEGGKAVGSWDMPNEPSTLAVADATGWVAGALKNGLLEVRRTDGSLAISRLWAGQPLSLAFAADGQSLYVADDAGKLSRLDAGGRIVWSLDLGRVVSLGARDGRLYAAGWDGRLRAISDEGKVRWSLDLTPALRDSDPRAVLTASTRIEPSSLHQARREPTTSSRVPEGENLLRNGKGKAILTLGGTPGWGSEGAVQIKPEALTNGKLDDVTTPWLSVDDVFWDAFGGRQVWAEIAFQSPTDVHALTVHEHPGHPDSWPASGVVQVWDESLKTWTTAARGDFLDGPTNTYTLDLKGVAKIRYLPWDSYFRNFYTSEIEVR
jgi:hypothetical protein